MRWTVSRGHPFRTPGDLLVIPVDSERKALTTLGKLDAALARTIARSGFEAAAESWLALPGSAVAPALRAGWVLLVGTGPATEVSLDTLRRVAGVSAQRALAMKAGTVVVAVPQGPFDGVTAGRCWVEGAELALSSVGTTPAWKLVGEVAALREGVRQGEAYAEGCLLARRLVNLPPNELTPAKLAVEARKVASAAGCKCTVLGPRELAQKHMGGILGVGKGSHHPPRLIVIESRRAARGVPTVALVGKGVTFDSGGISLKPPAKMELMKSDMAGAAAVLGALLTLSRLETPVRLVAAIPSAENMPGGGAIRPSDVLTMASGRTVEVVNTDAEGRLVLADALHLVCGRKPDYVIDIATLTGSCVVALGREFAGLIGTSGRLIEVLEQAGGETFERVWPLPLIAAHREALKSTFADLKNVGGSDGGALTAAAFLASFVPDDLAWAHLDIAGTAWTDQAGPLGPKGGTGFGARLLARAVEILGE
jgi:leucyl aminopeptidase